MPSRRRRTVIAGLSMLLWTVVPFAAAEAFVVDPHGYNLDLPVGWVPLEIGEDKATFAGPQECAYLQVKVFDPSRFDEAADISAWASGQLGATGDELGFRYSGLDAVFRSLEFDTGEYSFKGYAVCIDTDRRDYFISSFTDEESYDQLHDFLISCLDSFALDTADRLMPGPVSQFYAGSYGEESRETSYVDYGGRLEPFRYDVYGLEASRIVIEREARILTAYTQSGGVEAWKRYYRMLYRDNYRRLGGVWTAFARTIDTEDAGDRAVAEALLDWIQSFEYVRPGDVSDIFSPLEAAAARSGDCDSRGLLYTILLEYAGIDGILMVSSRFAHSIVGVDVEGRGARFPSGGKDYLVAETSDDVALGLIAAEMADPAGWIAVDLGSDDFLYE